MYVLYTMQTLFEIENKQITKSHFWYGGTAFYSCFAYALESKVPLSPRISINSIIVHYQLWKECTFHN